MENTQTDEERRALAQPSIRVAEAYATNDRHKWADGLLFFVVHVLFIPINYDGFAHPLLSTSIEQFFPG